MKENNLFNDLSAIICVFLFIFTFPQIMKSSNEKGIDNLDNNKNIIPQDSSYWPTSVDSLKNSESFKSIPYIRGGPDNTDVYMSRPKLIGGRICISTWGAFFYEGEIIKEKFIEDTCAKDSFTYIFKKKRLGDYPYVCVRYYFYDNHDTLLCKKQIVAH